MLPRLVDGDGVGGAGWGKWGNGATSDGRFADAERRFPTFPTRHHVLPQGFAGVRRRMRLDLHRRTCHDQLPASVAAFGAEVDDPVGGAHHVQVVLDDQQRVADLEQLAEGPQ